MTPEGRVKKQITALLKQYPHVFYDMPVPGGYGKSTLDYIGCARFGDAAYGEDMGLFFAIEAKAPGNVPTDQQKLLLGRIEQAGGVTFVVSGPGIEWNRLVAFLQDTAGRKDT